MSDQEKVELEAVPLKSDTDATTTETEDKPAEPSQPAPPVIPKKTWFFKKTPKKSEEPQTSEQTEEKPTECGGKKKCWWRREKAEKGETEQKADHISIGINLVDRDEKNVNDHVHFAFEDIFGEADTTHSWDCIWRLVFKIFSWTRLFFYRLGSLIIGIPAAIVFAILFALLTVINVFACVPLAKLLTIPGNWIAKTWKWIVQSVFDPLFTSLGLLFSGVSIRKYGINSQPTDILSA